MKKIFVVSQDAGGAEILSSLINHERFNFNWFVYTSKLSPAASIFQKKDLSEVVNYFDDTAISTAISNIKPDYFFYSTNWSDSNHSAVHQFCKSNKIPCIAFLDHWINYKERFGFPDIKWQNNLPDFITVGDVPAYQLAEENRFTNILKLNNYYFIDLIHDFENAEIHKKTDNTLLFISQTISNSNNKFTYFGKYEDETIKGILKNFNKISDKFGISQLKIRLHPSQSASEFTNYESIFPSIKITIEEPQKIDILYSLVNSKIIAGINSMALFIAFLVGKPAISIIPDYEKTNLPLPQKCCFNFVEDILNADFSDIYKNKEHFIYFRENTLAQLIDLIDRKFHK